MMPVHLPPAVLRLIEEAEGSAILTGGLCGKQRRPYARVIVRFRDAPGLRSGALKEHRDRRYLAGVNKIAVELRGVMQGLFDSRLALFSPEFLGSYALPHCPNGMIEICIHNAVHDQLSARRTLNQLIDTELAFEAYVLDDAGYHIEHHRSKIAAVARRTGRSEAAVTAAIYRAVCGLS